MGTRDCTNDIPEVVLLPLKDAYTVVPEESDDSVGNYHTHECSSLLVPIRTVLSKVQKKHCAIILTRACSRRSGEVSVTHECRRSYTSETAHLIK